MTHNTIESDQSVDDTLFIGIASSGTILSGSDYYKCVFRNCHFDETVLQNLSFDTCQFEHCNFNGTKLTDSSFKECRFSYSTFIGVDFTQLRESLSFVVNFENCNLSYAIFSSLKMSKSKFTNSNLEEVDFSEAQLDESIFTYSNLTHTIFNHTDLRKTDFRGAKNYKIDPRNNLLKGSVFSEPEVMSLLDSLEIRIGEPPESDTEI